MIERFQGDRGKSLLVQELQRQKLAVGIPGLPEALADAGALEEVQKGTAIIQQGDDGADVFFIVGGSFDIVVNNKVVGRRHPGDHVGEMAAISPVQSRSATVVAAENSLVLKVTEASFHEVGKSHPDLWRLLARELSVRLLQRNALIRPPNEKPRVFVISSAEALPVARLLQDAFQHDPFITVVWSEGVFKVSNYTLESLERELDQADFAVAIAHADDVVTSRKQEWPTSRDNVVFELGFFMGKLGRQRAILMEPRDTKLKLPSDLAGVTTIGYRYVPGSDAEAQFAPACNELRKHITRLGRCS